MQPAFVLVNPAARGGRGEELWQRILPFVPHPNPVVQDLEGAWRAELERSIDEGVSVFLAAGGDGTVNALLQGLVDLAGDHSLSDFTLGGIGLGSSNDFHKPFARVVEGIPLRIDAGAATPRDVGLVTFATPGGPELTRAFLVSGSIGLTAEGNHFFNTAGGFFRWLKGISTGAAILYAACRTILRYQNRSCDLSFPCSLAADGAIDSYEVTNLSIMKTPYLSGSFRYDTPVSFDDGKFAVNLSEGKSRRGMIRLLLDLGKGRFLGKPGNHHWSLSSLGVSAEIPFALELDGEVVVATRAAFSIREGRIRVCG